MSSDTEPVQNPKFIRTYSCFPLVHPENKNVERGGKLLLPSSALEEIDFLNIPYPLMFKVTNDSNNRFTHAGVFEFTAEYGQINAPKWLSSSLGIKPGDNVTVESVSLPSATFCRLEPLTRNFAYISDIKEVFENNLRYFACLTEGDVLFIHERNRNQIYKVKIVETQPEPAVNIFECEVELECSIPKKEATSSANQSEKTPHKIQTGFKPFLGQGNRLDGGKVETASNEETQKVKKTFAPFQGNGYSMQNKKRKNDEKDDKGPQKKKTRVEENQDDYTHELIFIRKSQLESVKKQSSENITPFRGQGHSLKDD